VQGNMPTSDLLTRESTNLPIPFQGLRGILFLVTLGPGKLLLEDFRKSYCRKFVQLVNRSGRGTSQSEMHLFLRVQHLHRPSVAYYC
jgi:hypothetical protein